MAELTTLNASLAVLGFISPPLLGLAVYRRLHGRIDWLEALPFSWGVGWIAVNLIVLIVNQILQLALASWWILLVVGGMILASIPVLQPRPGLMRGGLGGSRGTHLRAIVLLTGPAILISLVLAKGLIYPETGPDSIFYHLFLPRQAFETGFLPRTTSLAMLELPNAYPNLLITQQTLVYFAAGTSDQLLSRPVVPLYSVMTLVLLLRVSRPWGLEPGCFAILLWTSLMLPGFSAFGNLSVEIWSDMPVTFYSLLSLHYTIRGAHERGPRHFLLAGAFAGGAALTKYNGFLLGLILLAVTAALLALRRHQSNREDSAGLSRGLLCLILGMVVTVVPLIIRNMLLFRNPVYPFLIDVLGGVNTEAAVFAAAVQPLPSEAKLIQAAFLLSSPLFLLFIPSMALRDHRIRILQAVGVAYIAILLLAFQFESSFYRLVQPAIPAVAVSAGVWTWQGVSKHRGVQSLTTLGAVLLSALLRPSSHLFIALAGLLSFYLVRSRGWITTRLLWRSLIPVAALLAVSLSLAQPSLTAAAQAKYPTPLAGPLPVRLPVVSDEEVLSSAWGPNWRMWSWMNENLPPGALVMTLEISRYYVKATLVSPASPALIEHYWATSPEEAVALLKDEGIGYVLDVPFFREYRGSRPLWETSPVFTNLGRKDLFELLHEEDGTRLYRIR